MRTATGADGLTAGAGPFSGEVRLAAGPGPAAVAGACSASGGWSCWSGRRRGGARLRPGRRGGAPAGDGSPGAVPADATSGDGSHRFRFPHPAAPDADGRATVEFHRAQLPSCAFADHFVRPPPITGNMLSVAVGAGERDLARDPPRAFGAGLNPLVYFKD
ncbi:DUF1684 domain-containing protein [Streptomyces sp. NPDC014995]|uniref:DUF1684 domain-containing protein n=1 Tax=Streptomyces sp. NPDC014995 TaxID=3364936 RepID=UPI0036F6948A